MIELVTTGLCFDCGETWSGTASDKQAEKHTKTTTHGTVVYSRPRGSADGEDPSTASVDPSGEGTG